MTLLEWTEYSGIPARCFAIFPSRSSTIHTLTMRFRWHQGLGSNVGVAFDVQDKSHAVVKEVLPGSTWYLLMISPMVMIAADVLD